MAFLICAVSAFAQEDAITKYFNKYIDDPKFSAVYISPKMFSMVSKIEIEDMEPEVQEVIKSMKAFVSFIQSKMHFNITMKRKRRSTPTNMSSYSPPVIMEKMSGSWSKKAAISCRNF
jgi:hypothetical protein